MKNIHITMTALFAASGLALLSGCMMGNQYIPPTPQQLAAVGYGAPLTIDYKKAIPAFFFDKLKDPLSALYLFDSQPQTVVDDRLYRWNAARRIRRDVSNELKKLIRRIHRIPQMAAAFPRQPDRFGDL
jgi:hypothetical protein